MTVVELALTQADQSEKDPRVEGWGEEASERLEAMAAL
jgi:hypothetical protein